MITDVLRERILSGYYLGRFAPGDRLPSARTMAGEAAVDRKTVAAAYRHLEREGLVHVRPRSGVYLAERRDAPAPRPLERLYRRWLTNLYEGARSLELDTRAILHLVTAIAETEAQPVPVVDADPATAELLARELRQRLHVPATALPMEGLRAETLQEASVVVAAPRAAAVLARSLAVPVVAATLDPEFVAGLAGTIRAGGAVVFVPGADAARQLRQALSFGQLEPGEPPARVEVCTDAAAATAALIGGRRAFLWPGSPAWLREAAADVPCVAPAWCLAETALTRVRTAILDAAIQRAVESAPGAGVTPARRPS